MKDLVEKLQKAEARPDGVASSDVPKARKEGRGKAKKKKGTSSLQKAAGQKAEEGGQVTSMDVDKEDNKRPRDVANAPGEASSRFAFESTPLVFRNIIGQLPGDIQASIQANINAEEQHRALNTYLNALLENLSPDEQVEVRELNSQMEKFEKMKEIYRSKKQADKEMGDRLEKTEADMIKEIRSGQRLLNGEGEGEEEPDYEEPPDFED